MKVLKLKLILVILLINISFYSIFFIAPVYSAQEEIDPNFGKAPIIDGNINSFKNEWDDAYKISTNLTDLPINLWVMQSSSNLYISVQIELEIEAHSNTEFIGILISNSSSENVEDFIDAKIIQFTNISENKFNYLDDFINNFTFNNDTFSNGDGAAKLEGKVSIYEFKIPINKIPQESEEDVLLDYKNGYAFNITYGDSPFYPEGILKSNIFLINIQKPPKEKIILWDLIFFVLSIVIFSTIGGLYSFYIYKIFKLKEKIEKYRR